ncbi:MAG: thiamine-phosphate kinase [Candidatus Thorarchaeota archaeon]|jgi:thiamine-monophosphate kinase
MSIRDIGEREFLKRIRELVDEIADARLGFDEDASDIPISEHKNIVVNVDTFVRETDWLPGMTEAQAGRKTAIMALSDIVAKGATPLATLLSLCVPKELDALAAQELVRGFSQYCVKAGVPFIGGDVGSSNDVVLTGVAIGIAPPEGIVTRGGVKDGDIIAVTGDFGLTSVAFEVLLRGKKADDDLRSMAIGAAYRPDIHFGLVSKLAEKGVVSASMDSSDGLGITLNTMAAQSGVSLFIEVLPTAEGVSKFAEDISIPEWKMVMEGGEEFILVLAIPEAHWDEACKITKNIHVPLKRIGYASTGEGVYYETSEGPLKISAAGYDNFREWE